MNGHSLGLRQELHLGTVVDNADPETRGRIRVRLHSTDSELWAAVTTNSAGAGYGVSLLPRVGEQVVLAFVSPDLPLVLGAVWSGRDAAPDEAAPVEERYLIETPQGTRLLMDDANGPRVTIETASGNRLRIDESAGGSITVEQGGERVEMSPGQIKVSGSGRIEVEAPQVKVSAAMVTVDAAMSRFSGVVQCDTLISNSVVSASYTPGAGNIW